MPLNISNTVRRAISDGKLTADEVTQLKGAVQRGEVKSVAPSPKNREFSLIFGTEL